MALLDCSGAGKGHVGFSFSVPVVMVTLFVKHNDGIGSNAFMTFLIKTTA